MAVSAWTVTRLDEEIMIDVSDTASFGLADIEAIAGGVEECLAKDGVTALRFGGQALNAIDVPQEVILLAQYLAALAQRRGMRFHVARPERSSM